MPLEPKYKILWEIPYLCKIFNRSLFIYLKPFYGKWLSWTNGADNEVKCVHMAFKRVILNIKIYNDHGLFWGIRLVGKSILHHFHHIFYSLAMNYFNLNLTKYGSNELGWFECVVSSMWTTNTFVPMYNANGYGKFDNYLALRYVVLCHYLRRWLLTLNL